MAAIDVEHKSATPYWIAEVSSNHNQDFRRAVETIIAASDAGFSAVKFQLFKIEQLFSSEVLRTSREHQRRRRFELPPEWIAPLRFEAEKNGLDFGLSFFDSSDVGKFAHLVDFIKIASYEILYKDLFVAASQSGKPVIFSTGMATMQEIQASLSVLESSGNAEVSVMHCVSSYPTPLGDCNLASIETIRRHFGCKVGWSDHSKNPATIFRAVHRWEAELLELHFDLDGNGFEFEPGHCWLPQDAQAIIRTVNAGFESDGSASKPVAPSEEADRLWRADPSDGLRPQSQVRKTLLA